MNPNKLKGMRIEKGYTQEELAAKMGISLKTYNRKELGMIEFSRKEISNLAEELNLSIDKVNEIFFDNKLTKRISEQIA
ncbi:MAG: family transcriptional regulator [Anaerosolibacter sp.]|uniref:helix-turn-helix transcriptional regulator n=1 Tax=Anaerosolibacter sp. TaxID=1872527 RepID=UPI00262A06BD|nr:helix-turn-helix transcriptional regulator [Anaerosolibacter sp.]MDF2545796.1 family transcriptional regulator [Anaerosolibacter sp.]